MRTRFLWPAAAILAVAGCQSYQAKPLEPEQILAEAEQTRSSVPEGELVDLSKAAELMLQHSPRLREARAAQATFQAVADTPTPLPNPNIFLMPTFLDLTEISSSQRWGVEVPIGWSIPINGRLRINDELNALLAEQAQVDLISSQREEYLGLRGEFAGLAMASRARAATDDLNQTVETSVALMRRMVEAAQASALDVYELEVERSRVDATVELAEEAEQAARGALALRTGIWSEAFRVEELPHIPDEVPTFEQLRDLMLRDHPGLARLRADYSVAEKQLRLEVANQYPDLELGGLFEREGNVNRFGLGIGIELPIFDRNQQAIAAARANREQVRIAFEAEVARGLARIEVVRNRLLLRRQRFEELRTLAEPATRKTIELGRRALAAGAIDSMRYFALLRVNREVALELLDAQNSLYEAWSLLEDTCGAPLLHFPTDPVLVAPAEETES